MAAAVAASLGLGCTGDDDGRRGDAPASASELAEQLGCDRTQRGGRTGWDERHPVECFTEAGWAATIHAPLGEPERSSALRLLRSRYQDADQSLAPCLVDSGDVDVGTFSVIAGETWIVVVTDDRGTERVLDRLGGEIQPADGTGPPVSYPSLPCPDA